MTDVIKICHHEMTNFVIFLNSGHAAVILQSILLFVHLQINQIERNAYFTVDLSLKVGEPG